MSYFTGYKSIKMRNPFSLLNFTQNKKFCSSLLIEVFILLFCFSCYNFNKNYKILVPYYYVSNSLLNLTQNVNICVIFDYKYLIL